MSTLAVPVTVAPTVTGARAHPLRRLLARRAAAFGLAIIATFVLVALAAPLIAPQDPLATSWSAVRKAPSAAHWFGTDEIGRDVLSRVIYGARASLLAGVVSVLISLSIGVPVGLLAGYAGGKTDLLISRLTDALLACPFLILAIALAAFLGPSLTNAMIAIGISATPVFIRLTRGQALSVKAEDYILAARAVGNRPWRVAVRHVLPNVAPALIVQATLAIAAAIASVACTSSGGTMFGSTCLTATRHGALPIARAASTKSSAFTASVVPRVRRMNTGVAEMPIAIMAFDRLGPRNAASAMARMRNGQASSASVRRETRRSVLPPA
jgi:peptide/nickel transport system permease protein